MIKSVRFKREREMMTAFGITVTNVCEGGIWITACFHFSEQNMRWERS